MPNKSIEVRRGEYPPDWESIAKQAKIDKRWTCEHCGMLFNTDGKAQTERNRDGQPCILTVHHISGDKSDSRFENLLVCCQRCHLEIQAAWLPGDPLPDKWNGQAPKWLIERKLAYLPSRQMRLFET